MEWNGNEEIIVYKDERKRKRNKNSLFLNE